MRLSFLAGCQSSAQRLCTIACTCSPACNYDVTPGGASGAAPLSFCEEIVDELACGDPTVDPNVISGCSSALDPNRGDGGLAPPSACPFLH